MYVSILVSGSAFERCLSDTLLLNLPEEKVKDFSQVLSETFLIIPIDGAILI